MPVRDMADLRQHLVDACAKALWKLILMNNVRDFRPAWMKKNILNVMFRLKCRLVVLDKLDIYLFCVMVMCNFSYYYAADLFLQGSVALVCR